jgi:hypothetical protein
LICNSFFSTWPLSTIDSFFVFSGVEVTTLEDGIISSTELCWGRKNVLLTRLWRYSKIDQAFRKLLLLQNAQNLWGLIVEFYSVLIFANPGNMLPILARDLVAAIARVLRGPTASFSEKVVENVLWGLLRFRPAADPEPPLSDLWSLPFAPLDHPEQAAAKSAAWAMLRIAGGREGQDYYRLLTHGCFTILIQKLNDRRPNGVKMPIFNLLTSMLGPFPLPVPPPQIIDPLAALFATPTANVDWDWTDVYATLANLARNRCLLLPPFRFT